MRMLSVGYLSIGRLSLIDNGAVLSVESSMLPQISLLTGNLSKICYLQRLISQYYLGKYAYVQKLTGNYFYKNREISCKTGRYSKIIALHKLCFSAVPGERSKSELHNPFKERLWDSIDLSMGAILKFLALVDVRREPIKMHVPAFLIISSSCGKTNPVSF
jgi:hypothetical protein